MTSQLSKRTVNWVDGMKVGAEHFHQLEQYIDDRVRDAICLSHSRLHYGLVQEIGDLDIDFDKGLLDIRSCNGVTPDGRRIQIPWGTGDTQRAYSNGVAWKMSEPGYVVVKVDEERIPTGDVIDGRLSETVPTYRIELYSAVQVASDNGCIAIAKVQKEGIRDESYIPPCLKISANQTLVKNAESVRDNCRRILAGAIAAAGREAETAARNTHLLEFSKNVAGNICEFIDVLERMYREMPPFGLFQTILRLARATKLSFDLLPEGSHTRVEFENVVLGRNELYANEHRRLQSSLLGGEGKSPEPFVDYDMWTSIDTMEKYIRNLANIFTSLAGTHNRKVRTS